VLLPDLFYHNFIIIHIDVSKRGDKVAEFIMHNEKYDHGRRAAFPRAAFTVNGCCFVHPDFHVCTPVSVDGSIQYERLRGCRKCLGRSYTYHHSSTHDERKEHCKPNRHHRNGAIKPLESVNAVKPPHLPERKSPFDAAKGRCHHHDNVQLATKQLGGGWKVLHESCPVCRDEVIAKVERTRSMKERAQRHVEQKRKTKKVVVQFGENGFCINHPDNRVAKKKVTGSWKVSKYL
jgi:hypothetical protein